MTYIAVTGHRPDKLGGYSNTDAHRAIRRHMRDFLGQAPDGELVLLSGGALGIDQFWIEVGLYLDLPIQVVMPFKGYDSRWPAFSQKIYKELLDKCWKIEYLFNEYKPDAYQLRNQYLVDNSDVLVAYWNGSSGGTANCIDYARKRKKIINIFDVNEIIK